MYILDNYVKTPNELKRYAIDYTAWLEDSETVTALELTPDDVALVVESSLIEPILQKSVSFFISGGEDDTDYLLIVKITTSSGQIKEDGIKYSVREIE